MDQKILKDLGVEEMAQSVHCLPWKHGDLNSIPRTHVKKYGGGAVATFAMQTQEKWH